MYDEILLVLSPIPSISISSPFRILFVHIIHQTHGRFIVKMSLLVSFQVIHATIYHLSKWFIYSLTEPLGATLRPDPRDVFSWIGGVISTSSMFRRNLLEHNYLSLPVDARPITKFGFICGLTKRLHTFRIVLY